MRAAALAVSFAVGAALALVIAAGGACDGGDPSTGCKSDHDCPTGARCVSTTGVCVDFRNPDDASIPDLGAPDLFSEGGTLAD